MYKHFFETPRIRIREIIDTLCECDYLTPDDIACLYDECTVLLDIYEAKLRGIRGVLQSYAEQDD